jgi:gluconokinase
MGVSGAGKTTVGELLAARLMLEYADADDFHSPANVAKMAAGTPLTDADRRSWLEAIATWLSVHGDAGCVVSCSALKRSYRDVLTRGAPDAWFLHLAGRKELMTERVGGRHHHFMPAELVESQFEILEPPEPDERARTIDATLPPERIVDEFLSRV